MLVLLNESLGGLVYGLGRELRLELGIAVVGLEIVVESDVDGSADAAAAAVVVDDACFLRLLVVGTEAAVAAVTVAAAAACLSA